MNSKGAGQRSTRANDRGVDRGPGHKLTHKGPPVINTRGSGLHKLAA